MLWDCGPWSESAEKACQALPACRPFRLTSGTLGCHVNKLLVAWAVRCEEWSDGVQFILAVILISRGTNTVQADIAFSGAGP